MPLKFTISEVLRIKTWSCKDRIRSNVFELIYLTTSKVVSTVGFSIYHLVTANTIVSPLSWPLVPMGWSGAFPLHCFKDAFRDNFVIQWHPESTKNFFTHPRGYLIDFEVAIQFPAECPRNWTCLRMSICDVFQVAPSSYPRCLDLIVSTLLLVSFSFSKISLMFSVWTTWTAFTAHHITWQDSQRTFLNSGDTSFWPKIYWPW